jgi:hypothetical protein
VVLHHRINELKEKSTKLESELENVRKINDAEREDLEIKQLQIMKEKEDSVQNAKTSIAEMEEEYEQLIGKARTAGEPPMRKSGSSAQHPNPLLLNNNTTSRYAVRIPR